MDFREKLNNIVHKNNSLLCIGLDVDINKIPQFLIELSGDPYLEFNKSIIDSTKDIVCAYKLNLAFYEVLANDCFSLLRKTLAYI